MIVTARHRSSRRHRGSALAVALILTFALTLVVGGLLRTLILDKRLNASYALTGEARNAAEGAAEVAVAELNRRANSYSALSASMLASFTFPTEARDYLATGHVDANSIAFRSGSLSTMPSNPATIDSTDPFNLLDIDKGKAVMVRNGYIYAKASAVDPVTGRLTSSYISNLVQVREQTWLNYAVFYNMDMEMHSGSTMEVHGPVHTNHNAYVMGGTGQALRFYGSFTTAKKVYRKSKYSGTVTHTGTVSFPNKANPATGELLTMSTTQDSAMTGFKTFAESRWKGFVQDSSFQVPVLDPPDLPKYIPDNPTTTSTNELRNAAYAMIEPQLADIEADDMVKYRFAGHKGDTVENLKFSALAGLTIRVRTKTDTDNPWVTPATLTTVPGGFDLVYYEGVSDPTRPVNRNNLPDRYPISKRPIPHVVDLTRLTDAQLTRLNKAVRLIPFQEVTTGTTGNRALVATDVDPDAAVDNRYGIYDRRQGYQKTTSNNALKGAHHTVQIDFGKFKEFLNAPEEDWADRDDSSVKLYLPDVSWSGILYVQMPLIADSDTAVAARKTTDKIRPAVAPTTSAAGYAVVIRNAGALPVMPSNPSLRDDGFTFATNGPVYLMGHYNADGNSATGSSNAPDTTSPAPPDNPEVPALIAADAVTLLSSAYTDTDMRDSALSTLNAAAFTEIATAVIAGTVPTKLNSSGAGINNQWAGGVHNFVRFLENWSGDTYRSRGSVVSLFESEVSTGPWYQNEYTYWYNLPDRDIGYHTYFAGGKFPPGLPVLRTVRRISVADITAAAYNGTIPTPATAN